MRKLTNRQKEILKLLYKSNGLSITEILEIIRTSKTTIHRDLKVLKTLKYIKHVGKGRSVKYKLVDSYKLVLPIDLEDYFSLEQDGRNIKKLFNFSIFEELANITIFSDKELNDLKLLNIKFHENIKQLSDTIIKKEFERITIELSWKSSSIEGNTYSLLETERLLKDGDEAEGKDKSEAIMLLNHKRALDYIRLNVQTFKILKVSDIEDVHKILVNNLGVTANVRKTLVGITGTNFKPIDNDTQIYEALIKTCKLINNENNVFIKAFYAFILLAYIQPFEDGNKRTSRLITNAILLANEAFPLALRSIDAKSYKLATLLFYEINNIAALKDLFLEQAIFAGSEYFRLKNNT